MWNNYVQRQTSYQQGRRHRGPAIRSVTYLPTIVKITSRKVCNKSGMNKSMICKEIRNVWRWCVLIAGTKLLQTTSEPLHLPTITTHEKRETNSYGQATTKNQFFNQPVHALHIIHVHVAIIHVLYCNPTYNKYSLVQKHCSGTKWNSSWDHYLYTINKMYRKW